MRSLPRPSPIAHRSPLTLERDRRHLRLVTDRDGLRDCVTAQRVLGDQVVLLGYDATGRVQIEVRLPATTAASPSSFSALLHWLADRHAASDAPAELTLTSRAATRTPPRAD